jgi:hypothetical protein
MSDGDSATPGQHRAPDPDPDEQARVTRTPRPAPSAAPWERATTASPRSQTSGNHTEGVTVADLIAKVAGTGRVDPPARHNTATPSPAPGDNSLDRTEPIAVVAAYADEIPNLEAITARRTPLAADRNPEPDDRVSP